MTNYFQGGSKLLVAISWNDNTNTATLNNCGGNVDNQRRKTTIASSLYSHYEILFNGDIVAPTTEVQPGVLRCICPGKNTFYYT